MAKQRKPEDPPKGSPAWMATFSDLMNLLLCFFVLLFSMSTVDAQKFQEVIASIQSTISILPSGGATIGDGQMVGAGVRQLEFMDNYYKEMTNSDSKDENDKEHQVNNTDQDKEDETVSVEEEYKKKELSESEQMAEEIEEALNQSGIADSVEVDFNEEFVMLNLSGAILFENAQADIRTEAYSLVTKIGKILAKYDSNIIEIEGHTDNVPMHSAKYENNDVLSMYRALNVANFIKDIDGVDFNPAYIKYSGRGEYEPIQDNSTPEGRARNRRVEIKVFNSYNSNID